MKQQEIEFFWPLTEQIPLDLDYSQCHPHQYWLRAKGIAGLHGPFATGMTYVGDEPKWSQRIGEWEIPSENKQPNKFQKFFMKSFLGWKWMGK